MISTRRHGITKMRGRRPRVSVRREPRRNIKALSKECGQERLRTRG